MLARQFLLVCAVSVGASNLMLPTAGLSQETPAPEVANARYQFAGEITANNVHVRSGPREGDYATIKLDRGDTVTVVGIKFDWLKILPPETSFSYVSKAFVQQYGDGSRGRVTKNDLSVRAGSNLTSLKSQVQTKLMEGDEVEIIGEQDEYFRIKPPAGAYLYVRKDFVRPIRPLGTNPDTGATTADQPVARDTTPLATDPLDDQPVPQADSGTTADAGTEADTAAPQSPDAAAAGTKFNALEQQFRQISAQPLDEQPIESMLAEYNALASGTALPESMRRIAESRANALKVRLEAKQELEAIRAEHAEIQARRQALQAEQAELEQRLAQNAITIYTAVGTLRPSSLQVSPERLYRLTDPTNGRTLIYIRSNDPAIAGQVGQFIGVRGQTFNDTTINANVITPTVVEAVDMNQVGRGVAAQILPPSLLVTATASTNNE